VTAAIVSYNQANLDDFKVTLRYSKFVAMIDNSNQAIIGNETTLNVYKKIIPLLGQSQNISVNLVVPIYNTLPQEQNTHDINDDVAVWSSPFYYNGVTVRIEDDSYGNLRLMQYSSASSGSTVIQESYVSSVGSVDYASGVLNITNLFMDSYAGNALCFYARPASLDIEVVQNNLLSIELDSIDLTCNGIME
jgi:hypothetical protein